jgi:hypothetical protein
MPTGPLALRHFNVTTGSDTYKRNNIDFAISALVGSMSEEGGIFIAGEIKNQSCWIEFVLGTSIVCVIYVLVKFDVSSLQFY